MKKKPLISVVDVQAATRVLRAVNHKLRRDILSLLDQKKKMTVSDIWIALRIEQSVCSNHLGILRKEKIVVVHQDKKRRYYYLDKSRIAEINHFAKALVK